MQRDGDLNYEARMKSVHLLLTSLLVACGGGSGSNDDKITLPDASTTADAPQQASCLLASSLGTVTPAMQFAEWSPDMEDPAAVASYVYGAALNADAMPDALFVELYAGYGAFMTGYPTAATSVTLTGVESGYDTCGACVLAITDLTQSGATGDPYMATAGTLELTSVSKTKLTGKLTNVTLTHVTIDPMSLATAPHADGCTSSLASIEFDAVPEMAMDQATAGQPNERIRYRLQLRNPRR